MHAAVNLVCRGGKSRYVYCCPMKSGRRVGCGQRTAGADRGLPVRPQGWRIEVKAFPQLTAVGAWRGEGAARYGGFYTQDQARCCRRASGPHDPCLHP